MAKRSDGVEEVPCEICGTKTQFLGTKRCDRCYELESRIQRDPVLAFKVLRQHAVMETARRAGKSIYNELYSIANQNEELRKELDETRSERDELQEQLAYVATERDSLKDAVEEQWREVTSNRALISELRGKMESAAKGYEVRIQSLKELGREKTQELQARITSMLKSDGRNYVHVSNERFYDEALEQAAAPVVTDKEFILRRCLKHVLGLLHQVRDRKETPYVECPSCGYEMGRRDWEDIRKGLPKGVGVKCRCGFQGRWKSSYDELMRTCNDLQTRLSEFNSAVSHTTMTMEEYKGFVLAVVDKFTKARSGDTLRFSFKGNLMLVIKVRD